MERLQPAFIAWPLYFPGDTSVALSDRRVVLLKDFVAFLDAAPELLRDVRCVGGGGVGLHVALEKGLPIVPDRRVHGTHSPRSTGRLGAAARRPFQLRGRARPLAVRGLSRGAAVRAHPPAGPRRAANRSRHPCCSNLARRAGRTQSTSLARSVSRSCARASRRTSGRRRRRPRRAARRA